jgi:hypothetical protein
MVRHWRKTRILYKYASKLRGHSGIDSTIAINYHLLNQELPRLLLLRRARAIVAGLISKREGVASNSSIVQFDNLMSDSSIYHIDQFNVRLLNLT